MEDALDCLMTAAIAEARQALAEGEVPIGAVVATDKGRIIGRGHNRTEALKDVTAHAEMQALTAASQALGGKYLTGCILVVTVEPCLMCAGAAGWAQISTIAFGARDEKRGYSTICHRPPFHPRAMVVSGIKQAECEALMKEFFQKLRN